MTRIAAFLLALVLTSPLPVLAHPARPALARIVAQTQSLLLECRVLTDSAGQPVEELTYTPFGATAQETGPRTVHKQYTGKELDRSTGLYDYGARQYDAKLCRFTSPDPLLPDLRNPQALNRYSYVYNNPLKYTDPTGHAADYVTCDFVAFVIDLHAFHDNPSLL
jgi:RHS repeat-associated protein